jgi:predicted outer membrane repeat protein
MTLEMIMNNCSLHDNIGMAHGETAEDVVTVGNILIANSEFKSNTGIKYSGNIKTGGNSVVITNTNVIDNALSIWGPSAGIEILGGNILIDHCSVSGNHYAEDGEAECGGIMVYENASVEIIDSTITKNEGISGGVYAEPGANLTIRNCSISDNYASKKGGAIFNEGNLTVIGGTIEGNHASIGGSIWNANHMTLMGVKLDEVVGPCPWGCV